jgi:hypothetical protein
MTTMKAGYPTIDGSEGRLSRRRRMRDADDQVGGERPVEVARPHFMSLLVRLYLDGMKVAGKIPRKKMFQRSHTLERLL